MSCGESLYNYVNRQIKKISEKQHNFIKLQDRVNANIFNKLDEINNKLLDIEQGNNDEIKKEIEKLATQINEVKGIISQNTTENSIKFNVINNSILALQNKDKSQDTEIASIKEKNSKQDGHINTLYNRTQNDATKITNLIKKTDNTNTELETYKTNTSNEIDNINNTLNSVISYELAVNTGTEVNAKQDIFQNKVCSIAGFFKTSHMQTGWSDLIQLNKPYPKHDIQFVCFDSTGKKSIQCYIDNMGVIKFSLEYTGEKTIYFNVSYIA